MMGVLLLLYFEEQRITLLHLYVCVCIHSSACKHILVHSVRACILVCAHFFLCVENDGRAVGAYFFFEEEWVMLDNPCMHAPIYENACRYIIVCTYTYLCVHKSSD